MFFQEPMLMVLTLYLAFVYGIVYLLFEAIPISASIQCESVFTYTNTVLPFQSSNNTMAGML